VPALTVPQCSNCQALRIGDEADQQISAAFRRAAGLLAPEEIRQGREKLGLTQKQFANLLGVGEATGIQKRFRTLAACPLAACPEELLPALLSDAWKLRRSRLARPMRAWLFCVTPPRYGMIGSTGRNHARSQA
jgi:hypothetical protein